MGRKAAAKKVTSGKDVDVKGSNSIKGVAENMTDVQPNLDKRTNTQINDVETNCKSNEQNAENNSAKVENNITKVKGIKKRETTVESEELSVPSKKFKNEVESKCVVENEPHKRTVRKRKAAITDFDEESVKIDMSGKNGNSDLNSTFTVISNEKNSTTSTTIHGLNEVEKSKMVESSNNQKDSKVKDVVQMKEKKEITRGKNKKLKTNNLEENDIKEKTGNKDTESESKKDIEKSEAEELNFEERNKESDPSKDEKKSKKGKNKVTDKKVADIEMKDMEKVDEMSMSQTAKNETEVEQGKKPEKKQTKSQKNEAKQAEVEDNADIIKVKTSGKTARKIINKEKKNEVEASVTAVEVSQSERPKRGARKVINYNDTLNSSSPNVDLKKEKVKISTGKKKEDKETDIKSSKTADLILNGSAKKNVVTAKNIKKVAAKVTKKDQNLRKQDNLVDNKNDVEAIEKKETKTGKNKEKDNKVKGKNNKNLDHSEDEVSDQQQKKSSKEKKTKKEKEVKEKTATARLLVKKENVSNGVAVDGLCPIASHSHVFSEIDDIWDCMLNQTNIQSNNNKFYIIQLLKDDSKSEYSVWMRWGRVGMNGQNNLTPYGSNLAAAKVAFENKFKDKTKNEWQFRDMFEKVPGKYDLLKMDYSPDEPDSVPKTVIDKKPEEKPKKVESKLEVNVKILIEIICDIKTFEAAVTEMKFDAKKAPLGKLTTGQVKAGYEALKAIESIINGKSIVQKDLVQACNDFYTRIPHYFGMKTPPLISTTQELKQKIALLETLGDIQAAMTFMSKHNDLDIHPADQHYNGLKCDIETLSPASDEFKLIKRFTETTHGKTHTAYTLEILDIFKVSKNAEEGRFKDYGNKMLLWHGSRLSNWAGILSQGLKIAPPEAPCTGYMFGKGIYFADMVTKSANYCMPNFLVPTGLLVLCEVSLGKPNLLTSSNYNANKLPAGCHSVKALGRVAPPEKNYVSMQDGVQVPVGPGVDTKIDNPRGFTLQYNEYIVYDVAQVKMRYLVKANFNMR